jgi:hypothetical protein
MVVFKSVAVSGLLGFVVVVVSTTSSFFGQQNNDAAVFVDGRSTAAFYPRKLSKTTTTNQHAVPSWMNMIPRGGGAPGAPEKVEEKPTADDVAVEEVLYLPGLLDVELIHSDHVSYEFN